MITQGQVNQLAAYAHATFPPGTQWATPDGYPNSLALCILDSIWSIGVNYDHHVVPVIQRYRALARDVGRDPELDTPADLVATVEQCAGPDGFAAAVRSRHKTSSTNGILKAAAVKLAAELFVRDGVMTKADLIADHTGVKMGWHQAPGQRSGVSWKYFLMLAGIDGIKPDRMIHGYVTEALGITVSNQDAIDLLTAVRESWPDPRPTLLELDHAIWQYRSGRTRGQKNSAP